MSDELRKKLDTRLTHAGDVLGLTADEYAASAVLGGVAGLGVGAVLRIAVPSLGIYAVVLAVVIGGVLPSFLVEARMKERQTRIRRGLPYALDVLCLTLSAGADFAGATKEVVEKARSNEDLREEFGFFLNQLQVGHSRSSALRELVHRVPIAPIRELVNAIELAEERGCSIVATLEIQSASSRSLRTNEAELAATNAQAKIVVPTMAFAAISLYFMFGAITHFERAILASVVPS